MAGNPDETDIAAFLSWLHEHGARFPAIVWPCDIKETGRGAIALEDIRTNEFILEIPHALMMTPLHAFEDPSIGSTLLKSKDVLRGDNLLAVYIMHEIIKGPDSFYYPYLKILPEPQSVCGWSETEVSELQDFLMRAKIRAKSLFLKREFDTSLKVLHESMPESFPPEIYTFKLFKFAWETVQARAFGKRLKWSAMVPLADCLNHSNVQTKYDYDVEGNNVFRLFPTGDNWYAKGTEAYNSYGRRPNDNLLLDYGFALLDNEWDRIELTFQLSRSEDSYADKLSILRERGLPSVTTAKIFKTQFPCEVIRYLRIIVLNEEEMRNLVNPDICALDTIISLRSELSATSTLRDALRSFLEQQPTTVGDDELLLHKINIGDALSSFDEGISPFNYLCALRYRLTRKRIALLTIAKLDAIISLLEQFEEGMLAELTRCTCRIWGCTENFQIPEELSALDPKSVLISWKANLNYTDFSYLLQLIEFLSGSTTGSST